MANNIFDYLNYHIFLKQERLTCPYIYLKFSARVFHRNFITKTKF